MSDHRFRWPDDVDRWSTLLISRSIWVQLPFHAIFLEVKIRFLGTSYPSGSTFDRLAVYQLRYGMVRYSISGHFDDLGQPNIIYWTSPI